MIDVETRIEIGRPAADVFAFVSDQTNAPRWQSGLDEVRRLTPGPIRVGSEHSFVRRFAGRRIESRNKFVAFEPGRFVAFDIPPGGGVTGEASYLVEPTSASTSALTSRVQLRFSGLGRLIEPFMGRVLRRDVERDDQVLRAMLEAEALGQDMTGVHIDRDRPGPADRVTATAAVPSVARGAAVVCWVYAAGFGLPALPIAAYALRERELPWLGDLFPMYGGPWWGPLSPDAFAATLVGYAGVTAAVAWGGWLMWRGRRSGAVLAVAMIPIEAVFWYGYALPIPPALALLRVGLIAAAWPRLRR